MPLAVGSAKRLKDSRRENLSGNWDGCSGIPRRVDLQEGAHPIQSHCFVPVTLISTRGMETLQCRVSTERYVLREIEF